MRTGDVHKFKIWLAQKTNWTAHDVQDEILEMMALSFLIKIGTKIVSGGFYGEMADETTDNSQVEQMVICLRATDEMLQVNKYVLGLHAMNKCDTKTIHSTLKSVIIHFGIEMANCRSTCFDGASALQGLQLVIIVKLQEKQPKILLARMHCTNLTVQDIISAITIMSDLFTANH